jgi:hypothetical protein
MLDVRRRCAQTARISLLYQQSQRAILRQNFTRRQFPSVSPLDLSSDFPVVSGCHRHVSASVSGYLRRGVPTRKREKHKLGKIFHPVRKHRKIWGLAQEVTQADLPRRNFVARSWPRVPVIHRLRPRPRPAFQPSGSCGQPEARRSPPHRPVPPPSRP